MTVPRIIQVRPGAATWREVDDEVVLLDGSTSTFLRANPTASLLWKAMVTGTTREELVEALLSEFEVDRSTAEAAVDSFVEACRQRQLLLP